MGRGEQGKPLVRMENQCRGAWWQPRGKENDSMKITNNKLRESNYLIADSLKISRRPQRNFL